jgi:NAD(P)-dependent dehydrogenase (short-subunit alcohol dehydrogenase family)
VDRAAFLSAVLYSSPGSGGRSGITACSSATGRVWCRVVAGILDSFSLDGKVAIVTGASSGIGVAFATGLAEAGADVGICARRVEKLEETKAKVEALGRRCVAVQADVTQPEDCERVVAAVVEELGGVDVLINNAGVASAVPATRETPDAFRRVIDVNLNGSYFMAQACGRAMRETGGSIVNIGSVLGSTSAGLPQAAYAASKAAIIGLTRDLAQQWTGRKGIRVNTIAPGFFASEMTEQYPDGYLDQMMFRVPAGRGGEAREVVAAAVFLASDAASYITGVLLPVDGGMLTT